METQNPKFKGRRQQVAISELKVHPKAKAIYGYRNIASLAAMILSFGGLLFNIVVNKNMEVLAGWRRKLALESLGWTHVFVEILDDLPEAEEEMYIVQSNKSREKNPHEKFLEAKIYERDMGKQSGKRTDLNGEGPVDTNKAIAEKMEISKSELANLLTVGNQDEKLLDGIDGKNVKLTALAQKIRKTNKEGKVKYVAVEQIPLLTLACPYCSTHPTPRIVLEGEILMYEHKIAA